MWATGGVSGIVVVDFPHRLVRRHLSPCDPSQRIIVSEMYAGFFADL